MLKFTQKYIYYFISVALLIIALLAYKIYASSREDAWRFIPDNAFLVVESSHLQDNLNDSTNANAKQLADVPFFYDALQQLKTIQQSVDNQVLAQKLFNQKLITFSLHREAKRNLEYVVYIPYNSFSDAAFFQKLSNPDLSKRRIYNHNYKGIKVNELYTANNQLLFNFILHNDYIICSRSSVLLEEVIEKTKSNTPTLSKNPFTLSRKGIAHIYFRSKSLLSISDLLPSQLSPNLFQFFENIIPINPDIVVENAKTPNTVTAYVYSTVKSKVPFLSIFNQQIAKGLQAANLIPQNTSICYYMGFHRNDLLQKSFSDYLRVNDQATFADRDSVNRLLNSNLNNFYSILKNEVVLCEMETAGDEPSGKILLLKCSDSADALNLLDDYATKTEQYVYPKPQASNYLNFYIRQLGISQLPSLLFGPVFQGFSTCFYTIKDDYIILASDDATMRNYLNSLQNGQTWGASDFYMDFVKKLNKNAQTSIIINPQRIWNNIYFSLPPRWQRAILKHENRIKDLKFIAVESIVRDKMLGTKLILEKDVASKKVALLNKMFLQDSLLVPSVLTNSPIVLTNPITKAFEIITQHLDNQALLLTNSAKIIAPFDIKGKLINKILPTDFFQNGQLQYLAGTNTNFYVLTHDEKKGILPIQPNLPLMGGLQTFTTNESKVFVADKEGNIFVIDKVSQKISKIKTIRPFLGIISMQSILVKGTHFLAVLQDDGTLNLIYEQGASLKGFPIVAVTGKPNPLILDGENKAITFNVLSQQGEFSKVDLNGNITRRQMERSDKSSNFEVLFDQNQRDWLIARRSLTSLSIQNQNGETLFDIQNANSLRTQLKYYDLGSDIRIIAVFDGVTNTFFDLRGNMVGNKSMPATALPAITFSEAYNKLFIYNPNKTSLEAWTIKVK